jgi:flagellar protein FlaG
MEIQPLNGLAAAAKSATSRETPALPPVSTRTPLKAAAAPEVTPEKAQEALKEALEDIESNIGQSATSLRFSVDKSTGKTIVSVVDAETMEVVRQIPAEEIMKMARTLDRMQGLLFNGKA